MNEPRVGCGVAITRGGLLLIQRLKEPEAGCWSLAGGKVDWRESTHGAACREVEEELGIAVTLGCLLGVLDLIDRGGAYHWVSPIYHADRFSGEPRLMEPHKHGGMGWFAADELPEPLAEAARFAVERLFTNANRSEPRLARTRCFFRSISTARLRAGPPQRRKATAGRCAETAARTSSARADQPSLR